MRPRRDGRTVDLDRAVGTAALWRRLTLPPYDLDGRNPELADIVGAMRVRKLLERGEVRSAVLVDDWREILEAEVSR